MNTEQLLIKKWRLLPVDKQQSVIDFVSFLESNYYLEKKDDQIQKQIDKQPSELGKKLRQIRAEIIASGVPLLTEEEVEQEKKDRQGEFTGD